MNEIYKHEFFNSNVSRCDASKYTPMSKEVFAEIVGTRKIYLWGAGQKGRGFYRALKRNGFAVEAFLDVSASLQSIGYDGVKVIHPDDVLENAELLQDSYILTATVDIKNKEMKARLSSLDRHVGQDFDDIQTLAPFYPTIEVTGICNIQCSSCPRSDRELLPNGKYMSLKDYKSVVHKLIEEIPFLYLVDLYIWGEPILNKELPDIIRLNNELGLSTGISTNLNDIRNMPASLDAEPALVRVSLSGMSAETYEVTHTKGKWSKVEKNLRALSELVAERGSKTIIELYFHMYKHNLHELAAAKEMCEKYGFRFHPALGIIFQPLVLKKIESGGQTPLSALLAEEQLIRGLDELIEECRAQAELPCVLTRVVPVINWDMTVMACCSFTGKPIAANYLDVSLSDIIAQRTYSDTCGTCQSHGLHRWNNQTSYTDLVTEMAVDQAE